LRVTGKVLRQSAVNAWLYSRRTASAATRRLNSLLRPSAAIILSWKRIRTGL